MKWENKQGVGKWRGKNMGADRKKNPNMMMKLCRRLQISHLFCLSMTLAALYSLLSLLFLLVIQSLKLHVHHTLDERVFFFHVTL